MNSLIKPWLIIPVIALFAGCDDGAYSTLSPPENAHWVTVEFTSPAGTILSPAYLFYHSDICKAKQSNSSGGMDEIDGVYGVDQPYARKGETNIWQARVAIEGGGPCQWQLNSIKVSFKLSDDNPLVQGKNNLATNYIFDFGDYGLSDGYGTGQAKNTGEDVVIKTEFFPIVFINHLFNETTLKLFAGDTKREKWSRRYQLSNTNNIIIEPLIHMDKIISLESPKTPPGNITATYPDGSKEDIKGIYPDYEKLLSMK